MSNRVPLHAQRLADGTLGAYRLRVTLWQGKGVKPRRVEMGLGTNDVRLATERACYVLKGMLATGAVGPRVVDEHPRPHEITREQVEQWLADTGHVARSVSYSVHRRREMRRRGIDGNTPPLPHIDGGTGAI